MKKIIATLIVLSSFRAFAANVDVVKCSDYNLSLNNVYSMKTYFNGSVKVFKIDMEEPTSAAVGVAIAIDRGEHDSDLESFCRYVPGLSDADVTSAKYKYRSKNYFTLTIKVRQSEGENGPYKSKVLTLTVNKSATNEEDLVKAVLK